MNYIVNALRAATEYHPLEEALKCSGKPVLATGVCEPMRSALTAAAVSSLGRGALIILPDEKEARRVASELRSFFGKVLFFPSRDFSLASFDVSSHDFGQRRLEVLTSALSGDFDVIVTSIEAACQQTVPREILKRAISKHKVGDEYDINTLSETAVSLGYKRAEKVEGPGQFAVRGGIIDIFVPLYENPVRLEFFGDEIDSIGFFDVLTQRRTEKLREFTLTPCDEIFFGPEEREAVGKRLERALADTPASDAGKLRFITGELDRIRNGLSVAYDLYIDCVWRKESLLDYTADLFFVCIDQDNMKARLDGAVSLVREELRALFEENKCVLPPSDISLISDFSIFTELMNGSSCLLIESFPTGRSAIAPSAIFNFKSRTAPELLSDMDFLEENLRDYISSGCVVSVIAESTLAAKNLFDSLSERGITVALASENDDILKKSGAVYITPATGFTPHPLALSGSFELIDARFVLLTASRTAEPKARTRRKSTSSKSSASAREKIISYADLAVGDYVVHTIYGIGIYQGIEKIERDGVIKDFIKIKYAGSDVLYVPCSNLDNLSKYIGSKSQSPDLKLSKMGGGDWQKAKLRAKKAAGEIAKELIRLYSERMNTKGYSFSPDTEWQKEFEEAFDYPETDGQLAAAREIKADMESPHAMDRLLCGDVGFGKTEVALRGVFKCIMDNRQAAILVPTTILAWQHYQTILTRFRGYPVRVETLSRFRTKKEQTEILKKLERGEIDIIVGTHRLLQKDVKFRDLGFLVVDEEQRFGVSHKEKLKMLAHGVDVLTLTATPIPRTLSMAMSGIRDMSVLEEAPSDRFPVQTYVFPHDDALITEAIRKELRRGGQVFYLCNNIELLPSRAAAIREKFPDAVVETAHGKLDSDMISDIWRDMMEGKIDVLVCTTIIETGIDLPSANTLIIEDADRFGLSQLHQIRGRVGRSDRKAYAYLTYRPGKVLNEIAVKRLSAIREYSEFGSGFKLAMRDLEIRGAGNLLGAEQHGHLDCVGYDLYMKLLSEAVLEERGEALPPEKPESFIDLSLDAYIPESFIESPSMRIDIYKKIASAESDEDISDITDELIDRFGDIPKSVITLFNISRIKHLAEACGITRVRQSGRELIFSFGEINIEVLSLLSELYRNDLIYTLSPKVSVTLRVKGGSIISAAEDFLVHAKEFYLSNVGDGKNQNGETK